MVAFLIISKTTKRRGVEFLEEQSKLEVNHELLEKLGLLTHGVMTNTSGGINGSINQTSISTSNQSNDN